MFISGISVFTILLGGICEKFYIVIRMVTGPSMFYWTPARYWTGLNIISFTVQDQLCRFLHLTSLPRYVTKTCESGLHFSPRLTSICCSTFHLNPCLLKRSAMASACEPTDGASSGGVMCSFEWYATAIRLKTKPIFTIELHGSRCYWLNLNICGLAPQATFINVF